MFKHRYLLSWLGMAALIHGCTYSDYDHYQVEPIAGDPPLFTVTTNLDTVDLPVVKDSLKVMYEVAIQDGEFYFLEAAVGNFLVYNSDSSQGSFWLYPDDVPMPGMDTLGLLFYYSSNTNSLGDVLGIESLNTYLKYAIDFRWPPL